MTVHVHIIWVAIAVFLVVFFGLQWYFKTLHDVWDTSFEAWKAARESRHRVDDIGRMARANKDMLLDLRADFKKRDVE